MNEFKQVFNHAQQFLILQAYIDSQLSEEELMNFTLLETVDGIPVVFYSAGALVIQPNIDLDQFTHSFLPKNKIKLQRDLNDLVVPFSEQKLHFHFDQIDEAEQVVNDFVYLYSAPE